MINIGFISCSPHLSSLLYVGVPGSQGRSGVNGIKGASGGFIKKLINDKATSTCVCFLTFFFSSYSPRAKGRSRYVLAYLGRIHDICECTASMRLLTCFASELIVSTCMMVLNRSEG